ncbi:recombinase family protein [Streptomyces sp. NPDC091972]|uniref:recombinase family protein n=1 Tax=Streptomyces sp. NPDC091972 TaxID=3366007 RepID=UPI003830728A
MKYTKGASYERISKADDGDEDGVIRQGEDTAELAERRGIPLEGRRFRDNDKSATQGKHRPQYELLMAAVQRGEVDVIIVYMLGRLWRNRRERAEGIEILRKHQVSVLCVKGPELDLTTAAGRLLAGLLGEVDTFEVEQMSEREQRAMRQRVERGLPPSGPRCFGYTADGTELVEDEAAEVKDCFRALLAGATLSGMAAGLNERGILTRNGRPWSHNAIRGVLLNERYAGLRQYHGELYPGKWPVIVDEATWRAAKYVLEDGSRAMSPGAGRRWLLSGIARCGVCGDGTTVTSGSRGGPKGTRGLTTPLYRCRKTKHLARGTGPIDFTVEEYVIWRLSRPDAIDLLVDESAPGTGELWAKAVALRSRIRALTDEFANDDDADAVEFKAAIRRIKARLADVKVEMAGLQRSRILVDIVTAEDPVKAWKDLMLDRQRAVVETLATVTLLPGRPGRAPFDPRSVRIEPLPGMG